jgi:EmrB/QacA subfamily drug resistance transporter
MLMSTVEDHRQTGGAERVATWTIVVTGVACLMAGLDNLVVVTALPTIRADLGGGIDDLEWTVNAYTLAFAVLMMLGAAVGERYGRRRVFVAGMIVFTAASAAAALAPGITELIVARAFQGLGAAIIMPLTVTLLATAVPPEKRGAAFGIYGAVNGLAVAGGPLVGGLIVQNLSWQWIFWLNVPIGLVLAPIAARNLARSRPHTVRLDVVGTVLVSFAMLGLVWGLIRGNVDGWSSFSVLGALLGGVVLLTAFVFWEQKTDQPMLPMSMFRNRGFTGINLAGLLMAVGMFGAIFLLTQLLQNVQGYSPMQAGVAMLAWTAVPMVAAPIGGMISDKVGGKPVVLVGLALQAIALAYWAFVLTPTVPYLVQLPAYILAGAGMGLFYAPLNSVLMSSVPDHQQGIASGANAAARELGAAVGVALLAAIFSGVGGYGSGELFVAGLVPALWAGAAAVAAAAVAMLLVPNRRAPEAIGTAAATDQS